MLTNHFDITVLESNDIPIIPELSEYLELISGNFCKYINISSSRLSTFYTVISSSTDSIDVAEEIIFLSGFLLTERLRYKRSALKELSKPHFLCENIVFMFPNLDGQETSLLSWPHWMLKFRYTDVGILFGKFSKGAVETSKDGKVLAVPPVNLFSIRESVLLKDPKFFDKADWLLASLESSKDNSQSVYEDMYMTDENSASVGNFACRPSVKNLKTLIFGLSGEGFYEKVRMASELELKNHHL